MEAQLQMQIPVFNGDDHEIWSIKMRTLLMARDLWDVVESGVPDEIPCQDIGELANRHKHLRIKDMTALHVLQMSVTDSVFLRIGRATSSKQAWELLKADFGETDVIRCRKSLALDNEFRLMEMKNEESFHEFSEKLMENVNRSRFYGDHDPDYYLINKIFEKLPPRFGETKLQIRLENKFTLPEVLFILRDADCRNGFEKSEEASHNRKNSGCYSNNKRGRR